ncbi:MAG: hypothetical protein ACPG49_07060 [Chitinophagales bacterium]
MVVNSSNVTLQLGYKEVLQLVQQLSDGDKVKLVETIYADIPSKKSLKDTFLYLEKLGKKTKSVATISEKENNTTLGKTLKLNTDNLNIVSIDDVKNGSYQNKMNKDAVVGTWPGDEPVEELLNMLDK